MQTPVETIKFVGYRIIGANNTLAINTERQHIPGIGIFAQQPMASENASLQPLGRGVFKHITAILLFFYIVFQIRKMLERVSIMYVFKKQNNKKTKG